MRETEIGKKALEIREEKEIKIDSTSFTTSTISLAIYFHARKMRNGY